MPDYCLITKEVEFDAGHRVPGHTSKCRNPHGHRYRVEVMVSGPIIEEPGRPDCGMLVDFGDLKQLLVQLVHDHYDHAFIVWEADTEMRQALEGHDWKVVVVPYVPTAENIARLVWLALAPVVAARFGDDLQLERVKVWETPTSVAWYRGADPRGHEA